MRYDELKQPLDKACDVFLHLQHECGLFCFQVSVFKERMTGIAELHSFFIVVIVIMLVC